MNPTIASNDSANRGHEYDLVIILREATKREQVV